jgi:hypothetical protein
MLVSAIITRGSSPVAPGSLGSVVYRWLLNTVWPHADVSRLLKPMLVAQIIMKSCWLML